MSVWVPIVIAALALAVAVVGQIHSMRESARVRSEARESAQASDERAAAAQAIAERHAAAAESAAEVSRAMLEEMRRERSSHQPPPKLGSLASSQMAQRRSLTVEDARGQTYVLRNDGEARLSGIKVETDQPLHRNLPENETLEPGQGHPFLIAGTMQTVTPTDILVRWDGNPDGVRLSLPPK